MKKQVISLFLAFGISLVAGAQPQEKRRAITLEEAITIARVQSVDAVSYTHLTLPTSDLV